MTTTTSPTNGGADGAGEDALLATCWSSAGDTASDRADRRSPVPLRERIEAASAAGFTGFGLLSDDLPAAVDAHGLSGIATLLRDNGIVTLELEHVPRWWDDDADADATSVRHAMLKVAESLGASHLKVVPDGAGPQWNRDRWVARFAELAAQAEGVGARLGLEFFPWAPIASLEEAVWFVEDAGHPGGGVVIDVWHVARAATPVTALATVPPERIVGVELNDADAEVVGSLFEDTVHRRRFCGEGSFDLGGMITALRSAGWSGPWGVEILSDEYVSLPVATALERAARTARQVLAAAR